MALSEAEKQACRYYLAYPQISQAHALSLGIPDTTQLNFILEGNLNEVLEIAEPWVRRAIQELQCIEDQQTKVRQSIEVAQVTGSVRLRSSEALYDLDDRYKHWVAKLSDSLGAPPNPFSNKMALIGLAGGASSGVREPS